MNRNVLRLDVALAVISAIVLIVVAPGLAWVGIVALLVLLIAGISVLVERVRARRPRVRPGAERRPPSRRPPAGRAR